MGKPGGEEGSARRPLLGGGSSGDLEDPEAPGLLPSFSGALGRVSRATSAPGAAFSPLPSDGRTTSTPPPLSTGGNGPPPAARWRKAARSAFALQRAAARASSALPADVLPGLDVKRFGAAYDQLFAHINARAAISLVDYCRDNIDVVEGATNAELPALLARPRPEWAKVRWINIQGLSFELVSQLARAFDLHPLAVEDTLHVPQRIKADFYEQHLFVSFARFFLGAPSTINEPRSSGPPAWPAVAGGPGGAGNAAAGGAARAPSGGSGVCMIGGEWAAAPPHVVSHPSRTLSLHGPGSGGDGGVLGGEGGLFSGGGGGHGRGHRQRSRGVKEDGAWRRSEAAAGSVTPMDLQVEQVSIFLMRDGTVVSLFHGESADVTGPIIERLRSLGTLLTDSEDASFLVNVILDQIVDHMMPMVEVYARRIAQLEAEVLTQAVPRAHYTKELHLLANDCTVLRRALVPAQQLIHKLQASSTVEATTCAAAAPSGDLGEDEVAELQQQYKQQQAHAAHAAQQGQQQARRPASSGGGGGGGDGLRARGSGSVKGAAGGGGGWAAPLLSPLTRVYLSDVLDHCDTLVEDMESLALQAKELIELIFNSISHQSNASMQMLSIVNTVFLPLTFLAGVFGTNFNSISAYQWPQGFWFFWGLCAAVTLLFVVLLRSWGMIRA